MKKISRTLAALALSAVVLATAMVPFGKVEAASWYSPSYYTVKYYFTPDGYLVKQYYFYNSYNYVVLAPTPAPQPSPALAPTPAPTSGLTAEEQQMVDLVNQERAKAGLAPLKVDQRLVEIARKKSQDMIDNHYFSHQSPTYGSPFDMMKAAGISYRYAGENLAGNQSVVAAHNALMNSPGHRANILNPNYTHIGIGIVHGGPYGVMFTQEFIGI